MRLKKRNIFNLIISKLVIKELLLLIFVFSFLAINYESINAYELKNQKKLFSVSEENKYNIMEVGFKKLPDKNTILNKYERGKSNPFNLKNDDIPNASGLLESQIKVLGIIEYESKRSALIEYEGTTHKICRGNGGVCSEKQKSIFPKQWLVTDFDLKKGCIIYLTNISAQKIRSICQSK